WQHIRLKLAAFLNRVPEVRQSISQTNRGSALVDIAISARETMNALETIRASGISAERFLGMVLSAFSAPSCVTEFENVFADAKRILDRSNAQCGLPFMCQLRVLREVTEEKH